MLEGKELAGLIGSVGSYSVDVDAVGKVVIVLETNVFKLFELVTKKTGTPLDDKLLAGVKSLLGIKDVEPDKPAGE
jgi:hypothetical protein